MEESRWKEVRAIIRRLARRKSARESFGDAEIVEVFYWAVIHDRPQGWATQLENWPIHLRRRRRLPSEGTLSRRLRSKRVIELLERIEVEAFHPDPQSKPPLMTMVDGKALEISRISHDRQSGYGWGAGGMAKGYKIHVLLGENSGISAWRLTPMQTNEKVMARRMVRATRPHGYIVGDGNYDDPKLHELCDTQGDLQLVAPRYKKNAGLGHRRQSPGRLRSISLLEVSQTGFGTKLLKQRNDIERWFSQLVSHGGGLNTLPPWVRSYRRVHRWVSAKLVVTSLRISNRRTLYVAT